MKKIFELISDNSESILQFVYQFGLGVLGALLVMLTLHIHDPHQTFTVGTVNLTGIVDHFSKTEAQKGLSPEVLRDHLKTFGQNLEKTLHQLSADKKLVLFPAEAVIAGSTDYTPLVEQLLEKATTG